MGEWVGVGGGGGSGAFIRYVPKLGVAFNSIPTQIRRQNQNESDITGVLYQLISGVVQGQVKLAKSRR